MLRKWSNWMTGGKKGRRYYRKSFIWFLFAASVPGLIIGICTYWFAVGPMEKNLSALHRNQIAERAQNIDDQLGSVELDISHWAFHPRFGPGLRELNFVYHFQDTYEITKTLFMLQGSHPLIKKVQLYVDGRKPVLLQPEYYELNDAGQIDGFRRMIEEGTNIYWTDWRPLADGENPPANKPIVLVHKIPGESNSPFGVLVTELRRDKVINILKTMTPYNEGLTMLLDRDGELLVADSTAEEDSLGGLLRNEIMGREQPSGTFLFTAGGTTYSVSYGKMKRLSTEWTYVSAAPMTAITSSVIEVSNAIVLVSASGLLLALLLSWLASRRVYLPVERLVRSFTGNRSDELAQQGLDEFQILEKHWNQLHDESLNLRRRLEEQKPHVRSGFLLQLLQGHLGAYTEKDLKEKMKLYGWDIDDHHFRIVHIQLTGEEMLSERFSHGDEGLVTFAAANIVDELAAEYFGQFSVINFHNLTVGLLVMYPRGESVSEQLQALGERITKAVNGIIKMQVTITVSGQVEEIRQVPDAFMEVERATGYRKFVNQNQLIHMDQLTEDEDRSGVQYPFALERDIVHAVRAGDKREAERLVTLFLKEVLAVRGTEIYVQQNMIQLFGTIQHAMLQAGSNVHQLFHGENMFGQLSQIREPDKMLRWMKAKVIAPLIEEREARMKVEMKRMAELVESTVDYMHAHYTSDISLEQCADLAGTTPYTLSKYFKQITGVNFIDYLTELRIEKAKALLAETDLRINDIAVRVGYQQRYFNRIFKKQVGMTPGQFREQAGAS